MRFRWPAGILKLQCNASPDINLVSCQNDRDAPCIPCSGHYSLNCWFLFSAVLSGPCSGWLAGIKLKGTKETISLFRNKQIKHIVYITQLGLPARSLIISSMASHTVNPEWLLNNLKFPWRLCSSLSDGLVLFYVCIPSFIQKFQGSIPSSPSPW